MIFLFPCVVSKPSSIISQKDVISKTVGPKLNVGALPYIVKVNETHDSASKAGIIPAMLEEKACPPKD